MSNREEFEKWWAGWCDLSLDKWGMKRMAMDAWDTRQPEIDALKEKLESREAQMETVGSIERDLRNELARLKLENERLQKDAERSTAVHKIISDLLHDNITAMQSAIIEWQNGKGSDAALGWIVYTLSGPGLLPDESSPYGKEAQAWFDANKSRPFPKCFCGRPSHILWMGRGFCSEEHYEQREEHTGDAAMKEEKSFPHQMPAEVRARVDGYLKNKLVSGEAPADFGESD